MSDRICSVADCDQPSRLKGFCKRHYYALRPERCTVEGCSKPLRAKGLCVAHYASAGVSVCGSCGAEFTGGRRRKFCSPECRVTSHRRYSLHPAYYVARCKSCHKLFDLDHSATPYRGERHWKNKLTAAQVLEIRARYAAGGIGFQRLAIEYGVSKKQILNIVHRHSWGWLD